MRKEGRKRDSRARREPRGRREEQQADRKHDRGKSGGGEGRVYGVVLLRKQNKKSNHHQPNQPNHSASLSLAPATPTPLSNPSLHDPALCLVSCVSCVGVTRLFKQWMVGNVWCRYGAENTEMQRLQSCSTHQNSCQRCLASSSTTHHSHLVLAHAAFTLSTSTQGQVCYQRLSMRYTPRGRRHLQPMKCKQKKVKITTYL